MIGSVSGESPLPSKSLENNKPRKGHSHRTHEQTCETDQSTSLFDPSGLKQIRIVVVSQITCQPPPDWVGCAVSGKFLSLSFRLLLGVLPAQQGLNSQNWVSLGLPLGLFWVSLLIPSVFFGAASPSLQKV